MLATPTLIYLGVGLMHAVQQLIRNRALRIVAAPQTDYLVQALVMATMVELMAQNQLGWLSWVFSAPALLISLMMIFYLVMNHCTL